MDRTRQASSPSPGGFFIEDLFEGRAGHEPVYADRHLVVTRTDNPAGLRFAGEIDLSNSAAVSESIRLVCEGGLNPHLDLSNLTFCDVSGVRALIETALELGDGKRLLLHGLPEQLQTVMRLTGWSESPSLALCRCGGV